MSSEEQDEEEEDDDELQRDRLVLDSMDPDMLQDEDMDLILEDMDQSLLVGHKFVDNHGELNMKFYETVGCCYENGWLQRSVSVWMFVGLLVCMIARL